MTLSLIHPSRSRPEKAKAAKENWLMNAGCDVEYILSLDTDDPRLNDYSGYYIVGDNRSAVDAINHAARKSAGSVIVVMSDDFDCPSLWGKQILEATKGLTDWIMKTPDGIQNWIITLPIMDRTYYNRFGYVYYPQYLHMFCDTELSCVADLTGRRFTSAIPFKHNHYSATKENPDAVSVKADSTWNQGGALFLQRYKTNFDLPAHEIKGKITDQGMINWVKGKLR